jgi:hypothetical protein
MQKGKQMESKPDDFFPKPKYKFVSGEGDEAHASLLSKSADDGYRVTSMTYDPNAYDKKQQVIVLMELIA